MTADDDFPQAVDPAMARAMGHFVVLLLTVLDRDKVVNMQEFAENLLTYAAITCESDPQAGHALIYWAGALKGAAEDLTGSEPS